MKKNNVKRNVIIILVITLLVILGTVSSYVFNFHSYSVSKDGNDWANLGSYLGGILSPLISLISLIVLTYITYLISKNDNVANFNLNIVSRKMDAFEKLVGVCPEVMKSLEEYTKDYDSPDVFHTILTNESKKKEMLENCKSVRNSYIDLKSEVMYFEIRYGHIFEFDFKSNCYTSLLELLENEIKYYHLFMQEIQGAGNEKDTDNADIDSSKIEEYLFEFLGELRIELDSDMMIK
jgi:uncharacterized membrane protein